MNFRKSDLYAKGKRSYIFVKQKNSSKIGFKVVIDKKRTKNVVKNEYKFLKILNNFNIGPKVISKKSNYVSYFFVEGQPIKSWIKDSNKKDTILVIKKILRQCYILDKLCINKKELQRPSKHIIIKNKIPVMIDFEKCYYTKNPKNVTQFCQYLMSNTISQILKKKNIIIDKNTLISLSKEYKKSYHKNLLLKILSKIK